MVNKMMRILMLSFFSSLATEVSALGTYFVYVTGAGADKHLMLDPTGYGPEADAHYTVITSRTAAVGTDRPLYFFEFPSSAVNVAGINTTSGLQSAGRVATPDKGELLFFPNTGSAQKSPTTDAVIQSTEELAWYVQATGAILASKDGSPAYSFFACSKFFSEYNKTILPEPVLVVKPSGSSTPFDCFPIELTVNDPSVTTSSSSSAPASIPMASANASTSVSGVYTNSSSLALPTNVIITTTIQQIATSMAIGDPIIHSNLGNAGVGVVGTSTSGGTPTPVADGGSNPGTAAPTGTHSGTGAGSSPGTPRGGSANGGSSPTGSQGSGQSTMTTLAIITAGGPTGSATNLPVQSTSDSSEGFHMTIVTIVGALGVTLMSALGLF